MLLTLAFWRNALVRALKTAAQAAVALVGVETFNLLQVDWAGFGAVVATAALLSLLMSISQADEVAPKPVEGAPAEPARDTADLEPVSDFDEDVDRVEVL